MISHGPSDSLNKYGFSGSASTRRNGTSAFHGGTAWPIWIVAENINRNNVTSAAGVRENISLPCEEDPQN
jgi:hypothetical protein